MELTAAQRAAKRQIGRLERQIKRTNATQAKRKDSIIKLRAKLK